MMDFLSDPMFILAVNIFVLVIAFFLWLDRRERDRKLEERLRRLEEESEEKKERET